MKKFWRIIREGVVSLPIWCLWLGFFVGAFVTPVQSVPTWSWMNVVVSVLVATFNISIVYIIKVICRRSLAKEDNR